MMLWFKWITLLLIAMHILEVIKYFKVVISRNNLLKNGWIKIILVHINNFLIIIEKDKNLCGEKLIVLKKLFIGLIKILICH